MRTGGSGTRENGGTPISAFMLLQYVFYRDTISFINGNTGKFVFTLQLAAFDM